MELIHYAAEPVVFNRGRLYEQGEPRAFMKPRGFWVSVTGDDDWPSWCHDEGFALGQLAVPHAVELAAGNDVLHLRTPGDIDWFHAAYSVETEDARLMRGWNLFHEYVRGSWPVDWHRVAGEYDGLIIAPYQYSRRFGPGWYYGWDCASGCVWNLDAIESVGPVGVMPL